MMHLFQHSLKGQVAQWFARLDVRRFHSWAELSQKGKNKNKKNGGTSAAKVGAILSDGWDHFI